MIIGPFDTRVAAEQLRLLYDIRAIFARRGRQVASYNKTDTLLFDLNTVGAWEKFYQALNSDSLRRVLRTVAKAESAMDVGSIQEQNTYLTLEKVEEQLSRARELGLIVSEGAVFKPARAVPFGPTFEWYVAAVCMEELSSMAYWGVKIEKMTGDYDVVVIRETQLGYIECKSGRLGNIEKEEVINFLDRERILAPYFSIFLVDGVSRDRLQSLVDYVLSDEENYVFEVPGGAEEASMSLETEEYKNFIRLAPINSFFVSAGTSVPATLREIYRFLTVVCGRTLPMENKAAKAEFRA